MTPRPSGEYEAAALPAPETRRWSAEGIGAIGTLVISLALLIGHAFVVNYQVGEMQRALEASRTTEAATDQRMRALEAVQAVDRANADKRESLIEQTLADIVRRLDAIQSSVDQLQQHHPH